MARISQLLSSSDQLLDNPFTLVQTDNCCYIQVEWDDPSSTEAPQVLRGAQEGLLPFCTKWSKSLGEWHSTQMKSIQKNCLTPTTTQADVLETVWKILTAIHSSHLHLSSQRRFAENVMRNVLKDNIGNQDWRRNLTTWPENNSGYWTSLLWNLGPIQGCSRSLYRGMFTLIPLYRSWFCYFVGIIMLWLF